MFKNPLAGMTARARSILGKDASADLLAALADTDDLKPAATADGDGDPAAGDPPAVVEGDAAATATPLAPEAAAITEEDVRAAHALGAREANARVAKVFASEHSKGRERLAAKLLARGDMSADAIVDTLQETTAEAATDAGAAMVRHLAATSPAPLGSGSDGGDRAASSQGLWDKAIAKNFPNQR